ncbi:MAG TPA: hypothetical protein DDW50_19795 [Firmicutes bacterium]|nr:hypothetical protein [Bacillota bacterium]
MKNIVKSIIFTMLLVIFLSGCGGGRSSSPASSNASGGGIAGVISFGTMTSSADSLHLKSASATVERNFAKAGLQRLKGSGVQKIPGEKIVKFRQGLSASEIEQLVTAMGGTVKRKLYGNGNQYVVAVNNASAAFSAKNNSNIIYAEDNAVFHIMNEPNDAYYATDQIWSSYALNLPNAWNVQTGSSGIVVAVVDSGVAPHEDLNAANFVDGYDFVGNDSDPSDTDPSTDEDNRYSHGTHVAGIIAAMANNNKGIAGICWNSVKIMPVRVIGDNGTGSFDVIASGIQWAVDHGANVINLSFGSESSNAPDSSTIKVAINNALTKGIIVVAAAGNESHYVDFPANYTGVIAVAALGSNLQLASYSNYGPEVKVCAPGGDGENFVDYGYQMILSTSYDKEEHAPCYVWMSGTSMAAPYISGIAALMLSQGISPAEVTTRIQSANYGTPISTHGYSYSLPDACALLQNSTPAMQKVKVILENPDGTVIGSSHAVGCGGYYCFTGIAAGTYKVVSFVDANGNGTPDTGELSGSIQVTVANGLITKNSNIAIP